MQRKQILVLVVIAMLTPYLAAKATEKVLYRFTGGADGGSPSSSLVMDVAGNLYGTTGAGGDLTQCSGGGCGTVFELQPSGNGKSQEKVLYAFQGGSDGSFPDGNLVFDAGGNLYGTTSDGGTSTNCSTEGCGTVFELSPNSNGTWTKTVLYNFQNEPDGAFPAGLILDATGSLFGTTPRGGSNGGTVYKLSPPKQHGGAWAEKVLYAFTCFGATPNPSLVVDEEGNLYGSYYNLDDQFCSGEGCGVVFQLKQANGTWTETDLYDFVGGGNGGQPAGGVIRDSKGNLYGTGAEGGNNFGILFELRRSGTQWKESMPYNFCSRNNCADGSFPLAGLVMDGSGALYGTTYWGGAGCTYCGVVFKLSRTSNGWEETVLHSFRGGKYDGVGPSDSLILDGQGDLYGVAGSTYGDGAGIVFELTP